MLGRDVHIVGYRMMWPGLEEEVKVTAMVVFTQVSFQGNSTSIPEEVILRNGGTEEGLRRLTNLAFLREKEGSYEFFGPEAEAVVAEMLLESRRDERETAELIVVVR